MMVLEKDKKPMEVTKMEFVVKEQVKLPDGKYHGVVTKVEYRTDPYEYTDIYIKEDKTQFEIKYGCPSNVVKDSKLGKVLSQFTDLKTGKKVDPERILLGKEVEFMILNEKTEKGTFARVVDNSIRPGIAEEEIKD